MRKFSDIIAVEMSKSIPPSIVIPLGSKSGMFTLTPEKTVGDLVSEIQTVDKKAKKINITDIHQESMTLDTKLADFITSSFWISINK